MVIEFRVSYNANYTEVIQHLTCWIYISAEVLIYIIYIHLENSVDSWYCIQFG